MNKQVSRVIAAVSALTLVCGIAPVQPLADTFSSLAITASAASPESDFEFESGTITGYNGIDAEVEIPEKINNTTVTAIGDFAFQKCPTLTRITLPKTITTIGNGAFSECSSLWGINIPDSVTSIGQGAFWECSALCSIDLPNSVQTVGANAFYNCMNIPYLTAPCSLQKTENEWANNCNATIYYSHIFADNETQCVCGFQSLFQFEASTGTIEHYNGAGGHVIIPEKIDNVPVTKIADDAFSYCSGITGITLPDSLQSIGSGAFSHTDLTSITIPKNVSEIRSSAFNCCSDLTEIKIDENNSSYCDVDGVVFSKDKTTLVIYPEGKTAAEYTVPDTVTVMGEYCMRGNKALTKVVIPDSVTTIQKYALDVCYNLKEVVLPDSLQTISDYAFEHSTAITDVYYGGTESEWKEISIEHGNDSLLNAAIHFAVKAETVSLVLDGSLKLRIAFSDDITKESGWTVNGTAISTTNQYAEYEVAAKDFMTDLVIECNGQKKAKFQIADIIDVYKDASDTKEIAEALEAYCEAAKAYFGGETVTNYSDKWDSIKAAIKPSYSDSKTTDLGTDYYGSSLLLKSSTLLRHYYTAEVADSTPKGEYYYVDASVPAHEYANASEYCVNDYIYKVLNNDKADDNLKNICAALYYYGVAANNYSKM